MSINLLSLGDLEMATLEHLWQVGEGDAKSVHAQLGVARGITHNTVQSTLDRLHKKQILARRKVSHAFIYAASMSRADFLAQAIGTVAGMVRGQPSDILTAFVDFAARTDTATLDALERRLAERRMAEGGMVEGSMGA
jgi:predicted transcriptional regulator